MATGVLIGLLDVLVILVLALFALEPSVTRIFTTRTFLPCRIVLVSFLGLVCLLALAIRCGWSRGRCFLTILLTIVSLFLDKLAHVTYGASSRSGHIVPFISLFLPVYEDEFRVERNVTL